MACIGVLLLSGLRVAAQLSTDGVRGSPRDVGAVSSTTPGSTPTPAEVTQWTTEEIVVVVKSNLALRHELNTLKYQLKWFKRQLFGTKSEKSLPPPNPSQLTLGELPIPEASTKPPRQTHRRAHPAGTHHRLRLGRRR